MSRSLQNNAIAYPAEVARYLALEPADIRRMMEIDRLPFLKIPKQTRNVFRIPLRDFHKWLLDRAHNPAPHLARYETFLADFDTSARKP